MSKRAEATRLRGLLSTLRSAGLRGGGYAYLVDELEGYLCDRLVSLVVDEEGPVPRDQRHPRVDLGSKLLPLLRRDGFRCGICGKPLTSLAETHIDHVIALANGGTNDIANLQLAHDACNLRKGAA